MKWICSQIGAREHYTVARVLYHEQKLKQLYTDFWAGRAWRVLGTLIGKKNLATRYHPDLAGATVTSFNLQALKASRSKHTNPYEGFLKVGKEYGRSVTSDLALSLKASSFPLIFFGYDTGFLEPARLVKKQGGKTIVCQMDPSRFEVELVKEEEKRWVGWAKRSVEVPESYFHRREKEWEVADLVMVNSEWSRQALIRQGVNEGKIVVVPLAYEAPIVEGREPSLPDETRQTAEGSPQGRHSFAGAKCRQKRDEGCLPHTQSSRRTLRVLFLGQVILRKGIQYLIEAARLLRGEEIHFDIVGPIGISEEAIQTAPSNMAFHGAVSRDRTAEFYRNADVFVLPTLSDGFALTQLEAMAHGLPVIATPNCGEVVTDRVDGLIVPACDSAALAEAFQLLIQDPEKLCKMKVATRQKMDRFSLGRLEENLLSIENKFNSVGS